MNQKDKIRNHCFRMLSFLFPCGIMLLCFAWSGFEPFGENSPLIGDAGAQYYPFLVLFRRTLLNGESMLYTWRSGFGTAFVPLIAYFCFNFFNIIACFLPEAWLANYLAISICVRIGLAGLFFSVMMQTVRQKLDISAPVFATIFAMNGWILASFWQTVWLDVFALTPLVLTGLIKMVRDHDHRLYPLVLGLSLAFNFYLAFITCCMAGLFWIGLLIYQKVKLRSLPKEIGRFLGCSVLGAALAAVLLIPTALYLQNLGTYHEVFPSLTQTYSSIPALLGQMASFCFPIINNDPANISAGMLAILLAVGFLTASAISKRERLYTAFLLVLLLFSCWYAPLNFIWHGFHYPHVTVQRFAYLIPMVLAWMGWRYTTTLPEEKPTPSAEGLPFYRRPLFYRILQLLCMLIFTGGILLCAALKKTTDIILVCVVFVILYLALYVLRIWKPQFRFIFSFLLPVFVLAELCFSTHNAMVYEESSLGTLLTQPQSDIQEAVSSIREDANQNTAYRTAINSSMHNYEMLYDIPAASSTFTSMIPGELKALCLQLGYDSPQAAYYYLYRPTTPLTHFLLNQQYFISKEKISGAEPLGAQDDIAQRNLYRTYMGFCIPENVSLADVTGSSITETQNNILKRFSGTDENLYTPVLPNKVNTNDAVAKSLSDNRVHYQADNNPEEGEPVKPRLELEYTIPENEDFQLSIRYSNELQHFLKKYEIYLDGEEVVSQTYVFNLNPPDFLYKTFFDLKKGQKLSVKLFFIYSAEGEIEYNLDQYHKEIFDENYHILTKSPLETTTMKGGLLEGKLTAEQDAFLYLSVPYDTGWKAYVDGQEVQTERALDAMTGISVPAGSHEITLRYHMKGLAVGIVLTIIAWILYLLLFLHETRQRKKAKKQGADAECAP